MISRLVGKMIADTEKQNEEEHGNDHEILAVSVDEQLKTLSIAVQIF